MISIRILRDFQNCLPSGKFPSKWKKANFVPTFKKGDKQCRKKYRPVSILPVCGKVFEQLLFNNMFSFFPENDLKSPKQSRFRPGDSCTNQLLSSTYEILSVFDDSHEVRGIFLDISKAFDRVWREGLLFESQRNRMSGELITLIKELLSCRKQRVVLNGWHLSWVDVKVRVPEGQFLVLYYFQFTLTIYLMAWIQMLNSLQMIRHYFLLFIILLSQPIYWVVIFLR